jgi:hypothetical protein
MADLKPYLLLVSTALPGCGPSSTADSDGGAGAGDPVDAAVEVSPEACNGLDDDRDGQVDEDCSCSANATQPCYAGDPALAGVGACVRGTQMCANDGEFGTWGACDGSGAPGAESCNGMDDDCNGMVDDSSNCVDVDIEFDGDCVTVNCPAAAPYPVGCNVHFEGGDTRGCVASQPTGSSIYLQEGDKCGAGHLSGTLHCSTMPGAPLGAANCPINKAETFYPPNPGGCPELQ